MRKIIAISTIAFLLTLSTPIQSVAQTLTRDPSETIQQVTEQLLREVGDWKTTGYDETRNVYKITRSIVYPYIDIERMTQLTLGKYWRRISKSQREELQKEFGNLLIRTYARAIVNNTDVTIKYIPMRKPSSPGHSIVRTVIYRDDGAPEIKINYRMYLGSNGWKIYDVIIEGVSLVMSHRSSFSSYIKNEGIDKLIEDLKIKNGM